MQDQLEDMNQRQLRAELDKAQADLEDLEELASWTRWADKVIVF